MRRMEHFDVAVVGAGLAGLQAARQLSRQGLKVLLADAKAHPAKNLASTGVFVRRTVEDFPDITPHLSRPIGTVLIHSPKGQRLRIKSPHPEFRIADLGGLFSDYLQDAVQDGCVFGEHHRLVFVEPLGPYVALRFQTAKGARHIRARYVVGADGARSRVAADLGLSRNRKLIHAKEEVFAADLLRGEAASEKAYHVFVDPDLAPGYVGWLAADGQNLHLGIGGARDDFDASAALAGLKDKIASAIPLHGVKPIDSRHGTIPVGGFLKTVANERGLLVGNAAGAASPLTAGGYDGAMRMATHGAALIAKALGDEGKDTSLISRSYGNKVIDTRLISHRLMRELYEFFSNPALVEAAFTTARRGPLYTLARHIFFGRDSLGHKDFQWSVDRAWSPTKL